MTNQTMAPHEPVAQSSRGRSAATGLVVFASIIMVMAGAFQALVGLVGLLANEFYVSTRNYLFQFDATTWGWIHLLVGLLVAFAGFGAVAGQTWARAVAITLAGFSALTNFMFIPYYGFWPLLIIALDVVVIWALAVYHPKS